MAKIGAAGMFEEDQWQEIEQLVGRIVLRWGRLMGLVYKLPEALNFENDKAIALGLAQQSGDGSRITYMKRLLEHDPPLHGSAPILVEGVQQVLKQVAAIIDARDLIVHGIPLWSMKREKKTIVRRGYYLSQARRWDENTKYLKMPEAAEDHLKKLDEAYHALLPFAKPMLFDDWSEIFGSEGNDEV